MFFVSAFAAINSKGPVPHTQLHYEGKSTRTMDFKQVLRGNFRFYSNGDYFFTDKMT